jgi:hypothetical protein
MWHSGGQFSKTWESTPDNRDGFQNLFLHPGFSTYITDQPHHGGARDDQWHDHGGTGPGQTGEQAIFIRFRPSRSGEAVDEFGREAWRPSVWARNANDIATLRWWPHDPALSLAPAVRDYVIPNLRRSGLLSRGPRQQRQRAER